MSLEVLFEKPFCQKELKIVFYENFQFEIEGKNHSTGLIELDWMKDIIITMNGILKYFRQRNFNIDNIDSSERNIH